MRYLNDTAAYVLRYMAEHGILGRNYMQRERLARACGLPEDTFIQAEEELLQAGYITGTKGGMYGTMWLSSIGIAAYQSIKGDYLPIDTDAQHILTYLIGHLNDKNLVPVREILERTGLSVNTLEDSIQQLKDLGLIEDVTGGFRALKPTIAGRLAEKNGFRKEGVRSAPLPSAIDSPSPVEPAVQSGGTQPLGRVEYPAVSADNGRTEVNDIKTELVTIVDKLVNDMFPRLNNEHKKQYLEIAVQFQQEVRKPAPDVKVLRLLLGGLNFTSDMGGAFDPGDKVFQLVIDAEPSIISIASLLKKIVEPTLH